MKDEDLEMRGMPWTISISPLQPRVLESRDPFPNSENQGDDNVRRP
jgi:hypothetical protein